MLVQAPPETRPHRCQDTHEAGPVRFALLGPVEVWHGPERLSVGGARQRGLIAALALRAGQPVGIDPLIEGAWGHAAPARAPRQITTAISWLRSRLRLPVRRSGPGYVLDVDPDQVDALLFGRLVGESGRGATGSRTADAVSALRAALALWHGKALGGVCGLRAHSEELEARRVCALRRLFALESAAGQHLRVIPELRALIVEQPLNEVWHALLMKALYRAGRQVDALKVYDDARRVLHAELGVEPGRELRALAQAIRAGTGRS